MDIAVRLAAVAIGFTLLAVGCRTAAQLDEPAADSQGSPEKCSQKTLLKNWALSPCLAEIAKDTSDRDDANATASAYLEFGHQPVEAYDALRALAHQYASRQYVGSIKSDFNIMKCIDLLHSKALDDLTTRLANTK